MFMPNIYKIISENNKNKSFTAISTDCYNIIKEKNSKGKYSYKWCHHLNLQINNL